MKKILHYEVTKEYAKSYARIFFVAVIGIANLVREEKKRISTIKETSSMNIPRIQILSLVENTRENRMINIDCWVHKKNLTYITSPLACDVMSAKATMLIKSRLQMASKANVKCISSNEIKDIGKIVVDLKENRTGFTGQSQT